MIDRNGHGDIIDVGPRETATKTTLMERRVLVTAGSRQE
jgi:hypothetical protein